MNGQLPIDQPEVEVRAEDDPVQPNDQPVNEPEVNVDEPEEAVHLINNSFMVLIFL